MDMQLELLPYHYYNTLGFDVELIDYIGLCQPFVGGIFSILIGVSEFRMLGFSSVKNLRAFKSLSSLSV
ncbi:hypothetical protein M3212_21780, partial [Alkalihalobacillus oceani]|uniref:hypothetical protein n=1 Tax=Halalkalibacter oceani TaxID=1653776 RepID=UPI00203ADDBA